MNNKAGPSQAGAMKKKKTVPSRAGAEHSRVGAGKGTGVQGGRAKERFSVESDGGC